MDLIALQVGSEERLSFRCKHDCTRPSICPVCGGKYFDKNRGHCSDACFRESQRPRTPQEINDALLGELDGATHMLLNLVIAECRALRKQVSVLSSTVRDLENQALSFRESDYGPDTDLFDEKGNL